MTMPAMMASPFAEHTQLRHFDSFRLRAQTRRKPGILLPEDWYVDPVFPPDMTSLSYVYSGDDKYERMVFTRAKTLCSLPKLHGQGGLFTIPLPACRWSGRAWFLYAAAILALNERYLKQLIPGYSDFAQNFGPNYIGAFHFRLWRFGRWDDVIVDDFLPVLDDELPYAPIVGAQPELWVALLEKAFAKVNKAYEAIEIGNTLHALTDLTGAICEHYSLEVNLAFDLFRVVYKSSVNRSMLVCWRGPKSHQYPGFREARRASKPDHSALVRSLMSPTFKQLSNGPGTELHIITAATKFPLRDGRMLEMFRIKNPCQSQSHWQGDFSISSESSWNSLNPTFAHNFRPRECLEDDEFWIPFLDFLRHFSDLVICSSSEPYRGTQEHQERRYKDAYDAPTDRPSSTDEKFERLSLPVELPQQRKGSVEILVQESEGTVKVNTVEGEPALFIRRSKSYKERSTSRSLRSPPMADNSCFLSRKDSSSDSSNPGPYQQRTWDGGHQGHVFRVTVPRDLKDNKASRKSSNQHSSNSASSASSNRPVGCSHSTSVASNLSGISNTSNNSSLSDPDSTYSMSEIKLKLNGIALQQPHKERAVSMPVVPRELEHVERSRQASIFESRMDYFLSHGSWKQILCRSGEWNRLNNGGGRCNMTSHSRNPRITFAILNGDAVNEITPVHLHGKCHVIISMLQDYRQGVHGSSGMLSGIGFALYKSKNPEKDQRRNLSKLSLVLDTQSESESREITKRVDLDPGYYILVPYNLGCDHQGEFLVRILSEKDQIAAKTGCVIS